jgi:hypothetical protein
MKKNPKEIDAALVAAGFIFLGWENGWSVELVDENKIPVDDVKRGRMWIHPREDHPEYWACRDAGHVPDTVLHNVRGTENTVSCDKCKIYWKYDCGD